MSNPDVMCLPLYPSGLLVEHAQNSILVLMKVRTSSVHNVELYRQKKYS